MKNILLLRMSSMGDLIHTWPAVTDLARQYPDANLVWVAEESFLDIPAMHPFVSRIIPMAWRRWRKNLFSRQTWQEMAAFRRELKATKWDLVIDPQGLFKSAIPGRMANAPLAGQDRHNSRDPLASFLYDRTYPIGRGLTAIERNRQLFAAAIGYELSGPPVYGVRCGQRLAWLPAGDYAVMLHATSRVEKEWPEASWIALAQALQAVGVYAVYPWGNAAEQARAQRLAAAVPGSVVAPRLNLKDAAAMVGHADVGIGLDTGLTHLANAFDIPLVAVFTDSNPRMVGMVGGEHVADVGDIGVIPSADEVIAAVMKVRSARR